MPARKRRLISRRWLCRSVTCASVFACLLGAWSMRGRNLLAQTASVRAYDPLISFHDEPERFALPSDDSVPTIAVGDHGEAFGWWAAAIQAGVCASSSLSVFHVDKHDDMELPEKSEGTKNPVDWKRFVRAPPGTPTIDVDPRHSGLANNNFQLALVLTGAASRLFWLYPDFDCAHCDYGWEPSHACEVGLADDGEYISRPVHPMSRDDTVKHGLVCAAFDRTLSKQMFIQGSPHLTRTISLGQQYNFSMMSASERRDGATMPREWFSSDQGWILDIDLDYFVDDEQSPKMGHLLLEEGLARNPNKEMQVMYESLEKLRLSLSDDESAPLPQLPRSVEKMYSPKGLRRLLKWFCTLTHEFYCTSMLLFELFKVPFSAISAEHVRDRMGRLVQRLRETNMKPCMITVARSNIGGYTPLAATLELEEALLQMLRSELPNGVAVMHTATAHSSPVHKQLMQLIDEARMPRPKLARPTRSSRLTP